MCMLRSEKSLKKLSYKRVLGCRLKSWSTELHVHLHISKCVVKKLANHTLNTFLLILSGTNKVG